MLRDYFLSKIIREIKDVSINGDIKERLPNNINISIRGVEGETLLLLLDNKGIACSTGSACSASDLNPSHVLVKIGTPIELAHCSIRFTLGRYTKKTDIDYTVKVLSESVKKLETCQQLNKMRKNIKKCSDGENWIYSDEVREHFFFPKNILFNEENYRADGMGSVGSPECGDVMNVWIKVDKKLNA